jgi:hypothetical protein
VGDFGNELRRRRGEAGLSLRDLADKVRFSRSYLSKIENGLRPPTPALARVCDSALQAQGMLAALALPREAAPEPVADAVGGTLTVRLTATGGALAVASDGPAPIQQTLMRWDHSPPATAALVDVLLRWFDDLRRLGQSNPPHTVIPTLALICKVLQSGAHEDRPAALRLGARYAEYTGWMAQEAGDETAAIWWTNEAVALSTAGGDPELGAYALVRRAELALYRGDFLATIDLARQARERSGRRRVQAMAAQREAQGHAAAGHEEQYRALLRTAASLAAPEPADDAGEPLLGSTNLHDPLAFVEGWCLNDLGRYDAAAAVLDAELRRIPVWAGRARARCGARLALALAASGAVERACEVLRGILPVVAMVDSATVRTDLRLVYRRLGGRRGQPGVAEVLATLADTLRQPQSTYSIGTRS